jgi:hypothetical protein
VIRRTLALAGAAALALAASGLSGPAAADPGPGITTHEGVVLNEIAAELDLVASGYVGGFIELKNTTGNPIDISGWTVSVCTDDAEFVEDIPDATSIDLGPGETYLIGDFNYVPGLESEIADMEFDGSGEVLEQDGGGVLLKNGAQEVDNIQWGNPHDGDLDCASFSNEAGSDVLPTDEESINRASPWELLSPSPTPMD